MTTICALQNVSLSQIGPFFPLEAQSKGVSEWLLGFIIALNPIFYVIASLVMGKHLQKVGRKCALRLGVLLICSQLLTLGLLKWVHSPELFIFLASTA